MEAPEVSSVKRHAARVPARWMTGEGARWAPTCTFRWCSNGNPLQGTSERTEGPLKHLFGPPCPENSGQKVHSLRSCSSAVQRSVHVDQKKKKREHIQNNPVCRAGGVGFSKEEQMRTCSGEPFAGYCFRLKWVGVNGSKISCLVRHLDPGIIFLRHPRLECVPADHKRCGHPRIYFHRLGEI